MAHFTFNTISRVEISESPGGKQMLAAIDYDGDRNLFVTGVPGSGKTTVSLMRAENLINQKKKVLLITYQDLLATGLRNTASKPLVGSITTFYRWYYRQTGKWIRDLSAKELIKSLEGLPKCDELLIDEGQDLELKIIQCLLTVGTKITASADNAQRLHSKGVKAEQIRAEMEKLGGVQAIPLQYNYRNTFEIYNFARCFLPHNERANNQLAIDRIPKGKGELPNVFVVQTEVERKKQLEILLTNAADRNVAVLVFKKEDVDAYEKIIREELKMLCSKHHSNHHLCGKMENILVTTLTSAKGVEFQVVIIPNFETALSTYGQQGEHYYVGCTRPKESLHLISLTSTPRWFKKFDPDSYKLINYAQK